MNSTHLFAISIVAAGLIGSGGPATASDSGKELAPDGGTHSGRANSGVFSGVPDPNSPGGTKDAGKGSEGSGMATSSDSSSGGGSSGSSRNRSGSGNASDDMKAEQVGQRQDEQVGEKQVHKGMNEGDSQSAKAIKGEVLRIEGDKYYVVGEDGKEVGLRIDGTTEKTGDIQAGDRIEAQANEQNHALSIRSAPTTDRRNEHSPDALCTGKSLPKHQPGDRVDEEGCK